MILLFKKGIPNPKTIQRSMVGLRDYLDGEVIYVELDEFSLYVSEDKAESLANQLTAKVRKLREHKERDALQKKADEEAQKTQKELPLPETK